MGWKKKNLTPTLFPAGQRRLCPVTDSTPGTEKAIVVGAAGGHSPDNMDFVTKHLKHFLMTPMIDSSDVGRKKRFRFDIWKVIIAPYPHPTPVHATGVTPAPERCWKVWDQSSNISQAGWISIFKAVACLCLLSGSWAGLQHSQHLETRLWWSSPTGLALARLPAHTLQLKWWYHLWVGVDGWELMTKRNPVPWGGSFNNHIN